MTIKTFTVPVAPWGAVLPGVASPWADLSSARVNSALPQNFGPATAPTHVDFVRPRGTASMAQPLAVKAAGLPIDIRKQYAHKTRVNVGGDGATGPHPEREPA